MGVGDTTGIPLLKRISKLRAESMEMADPTSAYWIWVVRERDELVARLYSSRTGKPVATIQGWEYDFSPMPTASREPRFAALVGCAAPTDITWLEQIDQESIKHHIPQTPPFLVLQSARIGRAASGADVVQTVSRFGAAEVSGHIAGVDLLGPMHYSRSLAQTGMLLSAIVGKDRNAVPEVVNAKVIWHDTREYFGPEEEVITTAVCDRNFSRAGHTFVTLSGTVSVRGKHVLGTESFVYVLVPRDQHPATAHRL